MIPGFEKIVEQRIQMAREKGAFNDLSGYGKPLKIEDDQHIPEELRLSHKILKNSGFLPPEIEIQKEIKQIEDLLASTQETAEQCRLLKKMNFLIMKLNTARGSSVNFEIPQKYDAKIMKRISPNKSSD